MNEMRNVECGVRNIEHPTLNSQHPVESVGHDMRGCCGWAPADTAAVRGGFDAALRDGRRSKAGAVGQVARQNGLFAPFHPEQFGRWAAWQVRLLRYCSRGFGGVAGHRALPSPKSSEKRKVMVCAAYCSLLQLIAAWRWKVFFHGEEEGTRKRQGAGALQDAGATMRQRGRNTWPPDAQPGRKELVPSVAAAFRRIPSDSVALWRGGREKARGWRKEDGGWQKGDKQG